MNLSSSFRHLTTSVFYLFCASLPFAGYSIETGVVTLSLTNVALLTTFGLTLLSLGNHQTVTVSRVQVVIGGLALLLGVIIGLQAFFLDAVRIRLIATFLGCLLTMIVVTHVVNSRRILYRTLFATMVGVAIFSAIGFAAGVGLIEPVARSFKPTTVAGVTMPFIRTIGGPLSHGTYGVLLTIALSTGLLYTITPGSIVRRIISGFLFGLCFLGFVVAQSRSTFVAVTVTIAITIVFLYHDSILSNGPSSTVLYHLARFGFVVGLLPGAYVLYNARPGSALVRLDQFMVAVRQIYQYPFLGSNRDVVLAETGGYVIHNAFLGTAALFGLPALVILALIWFLTVRSSVQLHKHSRGPFLSVILLTSMLGGTVEHLLYFGVFSKTTWFAIMLVVSGSATLLHEHDTALWTIYQDLQEPNPLAQGETKGSE